MILIGGTHKRIEAAVKFSTLWLENTKFPRVNFLYAFNSSTKNGSPLINIKDLLLSNARKEFFKLEDKIRSKVSSNDFNSEFKIDISSDTIVHYANLHEKSLIVQGAPEINQTTIKEELKEINIFLKKTKCSVLIVPENVVINVPKTVHAISNLDSLQILRLLKEQLSFKPEQIKILSIVNQQNDLVKDENARFCQRVKELKIKHFEEKYKETVSDMVVLILNEYKSIPALELSCLYELCMNEFSVPLLLVNPKASRIDSFSD